jgi:hypothetical protein
MKKYLLLCFMAAISLSTIAASPGSPNTGKSILFAGGNDSENADKPQQKAMVIGSRTLSYCAGNYDYHDGFTNQKVYPDSCCFAIGFPKGKLEAYKGGKITKLRYALMDTTNISKMYFWIKIDSIKKTANDFFAPYTQYKVGWNEITLDKPIEITGNSHIFLGMSFVNRGVARPWTTNDLVPEEYNGLYFWHTDHWFDYSKTGNGNLAIEAIVEGLNVPEYDINLKSIYLGGTNIKVGAPITAMSIIYNNGTKPVSSIDVVYKLNNKEVLRETKPVSIDPERLDTITTTFTPNISEQMQNLPLSVTIEKVNGFDDDIPTNNTLSTKVSFFKNFFDRNVVMEEGTGTWCGWCPSGYVAAERMKANHPNDFVNIAVHYGDEMEVTAYIDSAKFTQFPRCTMNRILKDMPISPTAVDGYYSQLKAIPTIGRITTTADLSSDRNSVNITSSANFSYTGTGRYSYAYVLLEDSIVGYGQTNFYAGNFNGEMGGFENLSKSVKMPFYDVARGIYPKYEGENLTDGVESGKNYTQSYTITIPTTVQHVWKLSVVALLIDESTGEIVNAFKTPVSVTKGEIYSNDAIMKTLAPNNKYYEAGKNITTTSYIYNNGKTNINSVTIEYKINEKVVYTEKKDVDIEPGYGEEVTSTFNPGVTYPTENANVSATIIKMNGADDEDMSNNTKNFYISFVNELYDRNVVIEEGTGTWCVWCVRGIVAMKEMTQKHPDDFIGIAVHNNANVDAMAMDTYSSAMGLSGYPGCNIDRTLFSQSVSQTEFDSYYSQEKSRKSIGFIEATATLSQDCKSIAASASATFGHAGTEKYNCVFVVLEDSVTGYMQRNGYAGGGSGEMGGFESLSSPCSVTFYDVARAIYPEYKGALIADGVALGNKYTYNANIDVPAKIQRLNKLSIVALLTEVSTGEIVNAQKVKVDSTTGVTSTTNYKGESETNYYSLDGMKVQNPQKGIYLKKSLFKDGSSTVTKVIR